MQYHKKQQCQLLIRQVCLLCIIYPTAYFFQLLIYILLLFQSFRDSYFVIV